MSAKVLISSCLVGELVRFDGQSKNCNLPFINHLKQQGLIISVCPEVAGGLTVPRAPAEIVKSSVITIHNIDVTKAFESGAHKALILAKQNRVKMAILKARSPSCGNQQIYDGSFHNKLTQGVGITAKLLIENGIKIFNEEQLEEAEKFYNSIKN